MHLKASLLVLGGTAVPALAEALLGAVVYSRHGDRTTKHYKKQMLTNLGVQQNFQVGSDYRSRYLLSNSSNKILGVSEDEYVPSQIYASAPDQPILLDTATAFLQGLYPPLNGQSDPINNGTSWAKPLGGYQYVTVHGEDVNSPDIIWIKGDEGCPVVSEAQATFEGSTEYKTRYESTKSFYAQFWDVLKSVYDYRPENLTYANAFDIFDLINVARVHNKSSSAVNVTDDHLFQLRTLADSAEWALSYNRTQPARSIGGQTLAGAILLKLNETVTSKGKLKLSLLAGSYDNFLSFFGLSNLTLTNSDFYGLPNYASTMAFELFTEANTTVFPNDTADIKVRFLFRNGSDTTLASFPLFGRMEFSMPWTEFADEIGRRSIVTVENWCKACSNTGEFCLKYSSSTKAANSSGQSGMSNAVAGVIGAMVTLGVAALCGLLFWVLSRRRAAKHKVVSGNNTLTDKAASVESSQTPEP